MKYVLMFTSCPDLDAKVDPERDQEVYKEVFDWFVANGLVQQPIDLGRVIDNSYVDYALERLGRVDSRGP